MKFNRLLFAIIFSVLAACASNDIKVSSADLPKNSIASNRNALAKDMSSSVDLFIQRNLACTNWTLKEVSESKAEGQIVFTSDGQLYRGIVSEKWVVQQCGKMVTLHLNIIPSDQGGSIIRIKSV